MVADTKEPTMTQLIERLEQLGEVMRAYADSTLADEGTDLAAVAGVGNARNSENGAERAPQVA